MSLRSGNSRAARLSFWLGVWGVGTGYSLFLLLWHERHHPLAFLVALGFAAIASFIVESTRALIEGHEHPTSAGPRGPRVVVTILTLAVIELFVVAVHTAVNLPQETLASVKEAVLGSVASQRLPPAVSLAVVAALWMALGGLLAAALMLLSPGLEGGLPSRVARGAGRGALVGFVGAPLAMLAAVLAGRVFASGWLLVADPDGWTRHVNWVAGRGWLAALLMKPVGWLGGLWASGWFGKVVFAVLVMGGISAVSDRRERNPAFVLAFVGLCTLIAVPLFTEFGDLLLLLGLAAIVWGVPATAIGALAPTLRAPSAHPALWGFVAFGGAALLVVVTLTRLGPAWLLVPAVVLALAGVLFRRKNGPEAFWPLLALCGGMVVAGSTWLRQEATAQRVFERFHAINDVALPEASESTRPLTGIFEGLGRTLGRSIGGRQLFDPSTLLIVVTDSDLESAVHALPPADEGARKAYEAWLHLRQSGVSAQSQVDELRRLVALYPYPSLRLGGTGSLLPLLAAAQDPLGNFRRRFAQRIDADLAAASEVLAIERDMGTDRSRRDRESAALLVRLDGGLARWQHPPSLEQARTLRARLGEAVAAAESQSLATYEASAGAYLSSCEAHLEAPEALEAELRRAIETWTDSDRRTRAQRLLEQVEEAHHKALAEEHRAAARLLEICLTGSLGFWVCVGLLAGGAVLRREG